MDPRRRSAYLGGQKSLVERGTFSLILFLQHGVVDRSATIDALPVHTFYLWNHSQVLVLPVAGVSVRLAHHLWRPISYQDIYGRFTILLWILPSDTLRT